MSEQSARRPDPRTTRAEPPPFDPDPEIVGHREGNTRAIKRYKVAMAKHVAESRAERAARVDP